MSQDFPMNSILVIYLFDVWEIDFMEAFFSSYGIKYIIVAVN